MLELVNPLISIPFIKNFVFDPKRIQNLSSKKMQKYRNKSLKKALDYAYKVPLYKKKYESAGIKKSDINVAIQK